MALDFLFFSEQITTLVQECILLIAPFPILAGYDNVSASMSRWVSEEFVLSQSIFILFIPFYVKNSKKFSFSFEKKNKIKRKKKDLIHFFRSFGAVFNYSASCPLLTEGFHAQYKWSTMRQCWSQWSPSQKGETSLWN